MQTPKEELILIKPQQLPKATLTELIKHYVLREGTDYGSQEITLETKIKQVKDQIEQGEVVITFDQISESCTLMSQQAFKKIT